MIQFSDENDNDYQKVSIRLAEMVAQAKKSVVAPTLISI